MISCLVSRINRKPFFSHYINISMMMTAKSWRELKPKILLKMIYQIIIGFSSFLSKQLRITQTSLLWRIRTATSTSLMLSAREKLLSIPKDDNNLSKIFSKPTAKETCSTHQEVKMSICPKAVMVLRKIRKRMKRIMKKKWTSCLRLKPSSSSGSQVIT